MEYISTKEASMKWGISTIRITVLAKEGRIPGAQKLGKSWLIPANAQKPQELKAHKSGNHQIDVFSFPLYHFRPDWCYIKDSHLSEQGQQLLLAETAVLECRFTDALPVLEAILHKPENIYIEVGGLWNMGICCIYLNRTDIFNKAYLRLQMIFAKDFPHRDDLSVILKTFNTYTKTLNSVIKEDFNTDVNYQSIPTTCLLIGYTSLSKEMTKPQSADVPMLEIILRFLSNTSADFVTEMMHFYLLGIYYLRRDIENAEKHANAAIKITFEKHYYFPLVTYYRYFASMITPIIEQYPTDFQKHCKALTEQYETNFSNFFSTANQDIAIPRLSDEEYLYIYDVLAGLSNTSIAKKMGVNESTVSRRLSKICEKLGINSKKEMLEYLLLYI